MEISDFKGMRITQKENKIRKIRMNLRAEMEQQNASSETIESMELAFLKVYDQLDDLRKEYREAKSVLTKIAQNL